MIRYDLACSNGHEFEGWFSGSIDFDKQSARGLVQCPRCASAAVSKQIMAPGVARTDNRSLIASKAPVALVDEKAVAMREMVKAVREHVARNSDYVGQDFPEQARKIHYGETEQRAIHGEASSDDVRDLLDEGVEIMPLPALPGDHN